MRLLEQLPKKAKTILPQLLKKISPVADWDIKVVNLLNFDGRIF
jgi:hypothetical protein